MKKFIDLHKCGYVINKMQATPEDYSYAIISLHRNKSYLKEMRFNALKIMKDT